MHQQTKVIGVILAGGLGRRMHFRDKGLVNYQDRPMVSYAIAAMRPVVDSLIINANRNSEQYRQFGLPVVADQTESFDGPLAGVLTAMIYADADVLLVMPCDSPLVTAEHLQKLLSARAAYDADATVAFDGQRLHPVFLAIKTAFKVSLQDYLAGGRRRVDDWLDSLNCVRVDFSNNPEVFVNINTIDELAALDVKS